MPFSILNKVTDLFYRYFNLLFALVIAGMYANALVFPNMGVDASFYLRVIECIEEGSVPGYDLKIMYPPLVFYLLLPIKYLAGNKISYELFLGAVFVIQGINAFMIYKIGKYYSNNRFIIVFAALIYLFLSYKLEGEYFMLEPFINLWGLLAILLYLFRGSKQNYFLFLTGMISILGFVSKQYGIAYVIMLYILILQDAYFSIKITVKKILIYSSGIIFSLLIFYGIYYWGTGIIYDFFGDKRLSIYGAKNIISMFNGMLVYIYIGVYLLLLLNPRVLKKTHRLNKHIGVYLVLLLLFSFQLYFNAYLHYYILMLPGIIFIGILMFEAHINLNKHLLFIIIILSLCLNEFLIGENTIKIILSQNSTLAKEIQISKTINKIVPEGSKAYVFTDVRLYYLCHFSPALPGKYGFVWDHTTTYCELDEILRNTTYFIFNENELNTYMNLQDKNILRNDIISSYNLVLIGSVQNNLIFRLENEKYE